MLMGWFTLWAEWKKIKHKNRPMSTLHSWPFIPLETMLSCLGLRLRDVLPGTQITVWLGLRLLSPSLLCLVRPLWQNEKTISIMFTHFLFRDSFFWQTSGWCNKLFHSQNLTTDYLNTAFQMREVISGCCRTTKHLVECPTTKPECLLLLHNPVIYIFLVAEPVFLPQINPMKKPNL